ncbi:MAG: 3-isopropylmalate dehydrogenase [Bacteroidota bacterium]
MNKKIAVLAGDGIGPEVTEQAIKVMEAVAQRFGHEFSYESADVGAIAIDRHGDPLPDSTLQTCLNADAILFGAIGDPKYDNDPNAPVRPEQGLLRLRKALGLFCNIRPVQTYPKLLRLSPLKEEKVKDVDFVIYRELTSGIYFGKKHRSEDGQSAYDQCFYSVSEIDRISRLAFEAALRRRKKLLLVDKANVLESSRLWRDTVTKIHKDYPDVELAYMFVDNAAMQIIQYPAQFDVVLTSNMFGDILSDEASVLTGSMGLLPSASIGTANALFEPIHGSYPQAAGKDMANPMAAILSAAMLLDHLGMVDEAAAVRHAVYRCLEEGIGTPDLDTQVHYSCSQTGDVLSSLVLDENFQLNKGNISESMSTII